jgi:hypothetical protein
MNDDAVILEEAGQQSVLQSTLGGVANIFNAIDDFMTNNTIDVMYKALAFVGFLMLLFFIPATRKFAIYAALCVLLLLMLQSHGTPTPPTPATSVLPLPSQINTAVPQQSSGSSNVASSGSSGTQSIIGDILSVAGLFA